MIEKLKLPSQNFIKVQGEIYTTVNNTKVQVKTKFSLNEIYNEINLFNSLKK